MNTLIHADIFFFVATIGLVIVVGIIVVAAWYCIGILRDAKHLSTILRHAADDLHEDFESIRQQVTEEGRKARYIVDFFLGKFLGKRKPPSRASSHKKQDREGIL